VLHGDIHHDNILYFGERGWLAIDPKGLTGERGFDYANLFCNPDRATATDPVCFQRRIEVVAEAAGFDRKRLLQWVLAWAGLSAAWLLKDRMPAETPLGVAKLAAAELDRSNI
jgi:streptomycin 6-kinase